MARTFEEVTEEIKKNLEEICEWFEDTWPSCYVLTPYEYNIDRQSFDWCLVIGRNRKEKYAGYTYTEKMHREVDGRYINAILNDMVPRSKKLIQETMEAPWEEPI